MAKLNGELYVGETGKKLKDLGGGSPIGTIEIFSGSTAPEGYLFCQGQAVSRTTYAELFEAIGTTYGTGDGSTTFNLPNLKGRIPVGQDTSDSSFDVLGETGGEKTHKLVVNEMPSHNHEQYVGANSGSWGIRSDYNADSRCAGYLQGNTGNKGGDQPHNNLQPYLVLNYIIKAYNVASSAPATSQVKNSYSESVTDVYSCDYANKTFGGKILWTNANPSSSMATDTVITLDSGDYDVYEVFFKPTYNTALISSTRSIKGNGIFMNTNIYGGHGRSANGRSLTYVDDTHLKASSCFGFSRSEDYTDNGFCIPIYIIGYKTGLF